MKMRVFDQLHISGVNNNKTMGKGVEFDVSDSIAAELQKRGQAYPADMDRDAYSKTLAQKDQGGAPKNKALQEQQNKIIGGKAESQNQPAPTVKKSGKGKGAGTGEAEESSEV